MHLFFEVTILYLKLLMKLSRFFTNQKTNYLVVPEHVLSYASRERICRAGHLLPSIIFSIIIGVKVLPRIWPYYAVELEKNGILISASVFLLFIPVAIINGEIIERILIATNSRYKAFKEYLDEANDEDWIR